MAKKIDDSIFDSFLDDGYSDEYSDEFNDNFSNSSNHEIIDGYVLDDNNEELFDEDGIDEEDVSFDKSTDGDEIIDDPLKIYLKDIEKYPLLSNEEVMKYYELMKKGDLSAKQVLINSNLRLVVSIAKRYVPMLTSMTFLDVIQEGNMGLVSGVECFDPEKGALSTILTYWIRQGITRGIANKNFTIRKPVYLYEMVGKYNKLVAEAKMKGEVLSEYEICNELNLSLEDLEKIRVANNQEVVSINKPVGGEEDSAEIEDFVADSKTVEGSFEKILATNEFVAVVRSVLSHSEYYVLCERFLFNDLILEDIAKKFYVTRQWVSQTELRAFEKVKPYLNKDNSMFDIRLSQLRDGKGFIMDIKREPIYPSDIVKYMFIKEQLTFLERLLYWKLYFDEKKYSDSELSSILKIKVKDVSVLKKSLSNKLKYIKDNIEKYREFYSEVMQTYHFRIYKYMKEHEQDVTFKFENYTYIGFINLYFAYFNILSDSDKELLFRYFRDRSKFKLEEYNRIYEIFETVYKEEKNYLSLVLEKKD